MGVLRNNSGLSPVLSTSPTAVVPLARRSTTAADARDLFIADVLRCPTAITSRTHLRKSTSRLGSLGICRCTCALTSPGKMARSGTREGPCPTWSTLPSPSTTSSPGEKQRYPDVQRYRARRTVATPGVTDNQPLKKTVSPVTTMSGVIVRLKIRRNLKPVPSSRLRVSSSPELAFDWSRPVLTVVWGFLMMYAAFVYNRPELEPIRNFIRVWFLSQFNRLRGT